MQLSADLLHFALQPGAAARVPDAGLVAALRVDGRGEGGLGVVQPSHADGLQVVEEVVGVGPQAHQTLQAAQEDLQQRG